MKVDFSMKKYGWNLKKWHGKCVRNKSFNRGEMLKVIEDTDGGWSAASVSRIGGLIYTRERKPIPKFRTRIFA